MVFVVERNEDVVLLRARAPESIRAFNNGKNDVYRKEEKRTKWMNDPTHAENTLRRRTSSYLRVTSLLETVAFKRTD